MGHEHEEIETLLEGGNSSADYVPADKVTKSFGNLVAVNVSMELNCGERCCLLGANSCGKNFSNSHDYWRDTPDSRRNRGGLDWLLPSVFNELSVSKHLEYYAAVKGIPKSRAKQQSEHLVALLGVGAFIGTRGVSAVVTNPNCLRSLD